MPRLRIQPLALIPAVLLAGCWGDDPAASPSGPEPLACRARRNVEPPACGTGAERGGGLLPGPNEPGFDQALADEARRHDRQFHAITAVTTGVNTELSVEDAAARDLIEQFLRDDDGWDFDAWAGEPLADRVSGWMKVAGAYGGAGIAADAFRYGLLRDGGAACAEIEIARQHLLVDLDALHLVTAITGVEGVIARGFMRKDVPGYGQTQETTPLFDEAGNPLPEEKNNGTWRQDNSPDGAYPEYIWEDSCSRDMASGWALGYAAAWEVIRQDPSFADELKGRLQTDALAVARSLITVREEGYDLEIRDADGRRTLHGVMNENTIDRAYVAGAQNGFHAILGLGTVAAFAYVAEDPEVDQYVHQVLMAERGLQRIARDNMVFVDMGVGSNFSNYNMAFVGGWLAQRYTCDEGGRAVLRDAIATSLYQRPGGERQPSEQKQSLFDFVYAISTAGGTAFSAMDASVDEAAVERGHETLATFPTAPFWDVPVDNCDQTEIDDGVCYGLDGTRLDLLGFVGRGDKLVSVQPVPMAIRPPSNYFWRSNPYEVNSTGGNGTLLLPAVDFRLAYWMGRWALRP